MDAKHSGMDRMHEIAASLKVSRTKGLRAAFSVSTPDSAVALEALKVFRVGGLVVVVAALMLTLQHQRQQSAEPALNEDNDDGHSPERLEPPA